MKPYEYTIRVLNYQLARLINERLDIEQMLENNQVITAAGRGKANLRKHELNKTIEDLEKSIPLLSKITWQSELTIRRILNLGDAN